GERGAATGEGHNGVMSHAAQIRELNEQIRYPMWSVFRLDHAFGAAGESDREAAAEEVEALFGKLAAEDVIVRGTYDVSGFRADADVMIWWHAETSERLQAAYQSFRRTA